MRRLHSALLLAALAAASACGPVDEDGDGIADGIREPDNVSVVAPSTPQGSISGQVLTTHLTPLADVQVTLNVGAPGEEGPRAAQTDANGAFHFTHVPAGAQVLVTMSKEGFGTGRQLVTVPSTAGNFPINHGNAFVGPIALTELNGTLRLHVLDHSGRPARTAVAVVQASPAAMLMNASGFSSSIFGTPQGAVVVQAAADDAGLITFTGLPSGAELARLNGRYDVHVFPIDEGSDGIYESAGRFLTYTGQSVAQDPTPRVVKLEDARDPGPLALLATNVPSFHQPGSAPNQNFLKAGEPVQLVFNQALAGKSIQAQLTDETARQSLTVNATVGELGNVLLLTPGSSIEAGREYNVTVRVASQDSGGFFDATGYFFGGDASVAVPPMLHSLVYRDDATDGQLTPGETVFVNLTVPVGLVKNVGGLQAFLNFDANGSGNIGDAAGEIGHAQGYPVQLAEPTGNENDDDLFAVKLSGYTSRLRFTYTGLVQVPNQTNVRVNFDKVTAPWGEYQTIWAEPVVDELQGGISLQQ